MFYITYGFNASSQNKLGSLNCKSKETSGKDLAVKNTKSAFTENTIAISYSAADPGVPGEGRQPQRCGRQPMNPSVLYTHLLQPFILTVSFGHTG